MSVNKPNDYPIEFRVEFPVGVLKVASWTTHTEFQDRDEHGKPP